MAPHDDDIYDALGVNVHGKDVWQIGFTAEARGFIPSRHPTTRFWRLFVIDEVVKSLFIYSHHCNND